MHFLSNALSPDLAELGLTLVLTGYYTYKAITAFANGDILAGVFYTLDLILTIVIFWRLAKVHTAGKGNVVQMNKVQKLDFGWKVRSGSGTWKPRSYSAATEAYWSGQQTMRTIKAASTWKFVPGTLGTWAWMATGLIASGTVNALIETLWDNRKPAWDPWVIYVR